VTADYKAERAFHSSSSRCLREYINLSQHSTSQFLFPFREDTLRRAEGK